MAPSAPPLSASAGPALFHATSRRHRETCTRNPGYVAALAAAPTRVLRVVNGDIPVASSPAQMPTDRDTTPTDENAGSPSTATASANRDSLFSLAGEDHFSHTSGDESSYITARSSSGSLLSAAEEFPIRRYSERRNFDVVSVNSSASSEEFPMRRNNPSRLTSDLGSDSSAAVAASLAENRRIFSEGFEKMAAHQSQLEILAQTILVGQERARSDAVRVARKRMTVERRRATTEQEAMQMLVEAVPFSADGRGHCDESEVRRVALRGMRWSMMSDSPYPQVYR